jgi:hypothetical protein
MVFKGIMSELYDQPIKAINLPVNPERPDGDISQCEEELRNLGFSASEIKELNDQLDGIIERGLDKYFLKLYE